MSADHTAPAHERLASRPGSRRVVEAFILITTILASSMAIIDGNVVTIALPEIQRHFGASLAGQQWVVESYLLTLTALMLTGGALGDLLGRRRIFVIGVVIFAIASAACGLAQTIGQLIAARALQGIGGALLVPGSLAIITACFEEKRRGRAIGTWSAFSAVTVAIAPLLGGWLIEAAGWRWIFLINLPIAAVVVFLSVTRVPESRDKDACGIDYAGLCLVAIGLGGLIFALIEAPRLGFASPFVWATGAIGIVSLTLFVRVEARVRDPMLPLGVFRNRAFAGANGLTLLLYCGMGGVMFFMPIHLISTLGYSELEAGMAILPLIVLISTLSPLTGGLVDRFGARLPLTLGPALAGFGALLLAWPGIEGSYWATFFPGITVLGLGMALTVAPLTTAVMNATPSENAGVASGINNAAARLAFLLAVAVLGIGAAWRFTAAFGDVATGMAIPEEVIIGMGDSLRQMAGTQPPPGLPDELTRLVGSAINQAALTSFRTICIVCAVLCWLGTAVIMLTFGPKGTNRAA
ncbi:MAG: MFS transporter [Pseudomonadota bacterium]